VTGQPNFKKAEVSNGARGGREGLMVRVPRDLTAEESFHRDGLHRV